MARIFAIPFTLLLTILSKKIGTRLFDRVWAKFDDGDAAGPDDPEATVGRVLTVAALQALLIATLRVLLDRGARNAFRFLFWSGEKPPRRAA